MVSKTYFHIKNNAVRAKDIFTYHRKMKRLKGAFFLVAVLGGAIFLFFPMGVKNLHWIKKKETAVESIVPSKHALTMKETQDFQKEMLSPVFTGKDAQDRPFKISADYAKEEQDGDVDLIAPKGDLDLGGGNSFTVRALKGKFTNHRKKLQLEGQVVVTYGDCALETPAAEANLSSGEAKGDLEVRTLCPGVQIQATGFTMDKAKGTFTYAGRPRVLFTKSPTPSL